MPRTYPVDNLDVNKVLELYNHGVGVAGIAKRLGFTRTQMIRFFRIHHIHMRNPKEQQIERMKFSTPEQIAHLVEAANKASRGKKRTLKEMEKMAITKYKHSKVNSVYEQSFIQILNELNIKYEF